MTTQLTTNSRILMSACEFKDCLSGKELVDRIEEALYEDARGRALLLKTAPNDIKVSGFCEEDNLRVAALLLQLRKDYFEGIIHFPPLVVSSNTQTPQEGCIIFFNKVATMSQLILEIEDGISLCQLRTFAQALNVDFVHTHYPFALLRKIRQTFHPEQYGVLYERTSQETESKVKRYVVQPESDLIVVFDGVNTSRTFVHYIFTDFIPLTETYRLTDFLCE